MTIYSLKNPEMLINKTIDIIKVFTDILFDELAEMEDNSNVPYIDILCVNSDIEEYKKLIKDLELLKQFTSEQLKKEFYNETKKNI